MFLNSDEEEDYSSGINTFIYEATQRRKQRNEIDGHVTEDLIGVENRIIGCLTFEKKYVRHKERVIHLTILTVRPRYRKYGIGKYLLTQVIDPTVTGQYEAVVVHADNGAVEFFQKFGFSDDVVLNSRWSELAEQFTNCTLMCYLPGFTGHTILSTINLPGLEVYEMEQELKKWKDKTLESYQAQVSCVTRMKCEILELQKKVKSQDEIIKMLALSNERIKKEKSELEFELSKYKSTNVINKPKDLPIVPIDNETMVDDISTEDLIKELQDQIDMKLFENGLKSPLVDGEHDHFPILPHKVQQEPYDHMVDAALFYDITQQFKEAMCVDPSIRVQYEVTSVNKSTVSTKVKEKYLENNQSLHDPNMVTQLYYCGGQQDPQRLQDIIHNGFTNNDFCQGDYGTGLYFSKYPSKAAQFSTSGKLLLAEVGLGYVETVTKTDKERQQPSDGHDSIIIPGRLSQYDDSHYEVMYNQEYVVFNSYQVLPLCLINYVNAKTES